MYWIHGYIRYQYQCLRIKIVNMFLPRSEYLVILAVVQGWTSHFTKENLLGNWLSLHNLSTERGGSPIDATVTLGARATSVHVKLRDGNH